MGRAESALPCLSALAMVSWCVSDTPGRLHADSSPLPLPLPMAEPLDGNASPLILQECHVGSWAWLIKLHSNR